MSFDFRGTANREVSKAAYEVPAIQKNREKITTQELLGRELTIDEFDIVPVHEKGGAVKVNPETGEAVMQGILHFAEEPDRYYCAGSITTRVCYAWAEPFDSTEEASVELGKAGGVRVRFRQAQTNRGFPVTIPDFLD